MKRPRVWEFIRSLILVTAITLLIWLWAEGENVRPYPLAGEVTFVAASGQTLLIEAQQPEQTIQVTIRSNVNRREEAQRILNSPIKIDVSEDPNQPSVVRSVDLLDHLRNMPEFVNNGITVIDVRPQTMAAKVERLVDVVLPIRVDTGDVALATPAQLDVSQATVRVPKRLQDSLAGLSLTAKPDPERLALLPVDEPHTFSPVLLSLPDGYPNRNEVAQIEPSNVRVTLTVRSQTDKLKIDTISVMTILPTAEVGRFTISIDDRQRVLRDIEVAGPTDVLNRIRNKELTVEAVLRFSADDLETYAARETVTWPVIVETPPNVVVQNPPPPMTFRIIKLTTAREGIVEPLPPTPLP